MNRIRPLAICVFRRHDCILVAEGYDPVKEEHFYRPLGGGIEFGERSPDTVCRELLEELNVQVKRDSLKYLGAVENIFYFNGTPSHEIIMIYDGEFDQPGLYEQSLLQGQEANGEDIRAMWKRIDEFGAGKAILYPTGLLELLK